MRSHYIQSVISERVNRNLFIYLFICANLAEALPSGEQWMYMAGVTTLLNSPNHFSKFEILRESQLNTYLKGLQKRY